MRIKCNISDINEIKRRELDLTYKNEYVVLGIDYKSEDDINYMIVDDTEVYYPSFYSITFFDIIDYRLSKHWNYKLGDYYPISDIKYPCSITFKDALREFFFDDLINNKNNTQKIFLKNKYLLEHEFPDKTLKTAILIEDNWCFCAYCDQAWNITITNEGIVYCPYCFKKNNNPIWTGPPPTPSIK